MRKIILSVMLLMAGFHLKAQLAPFPTMDSVNINNINAMVLVHGDQWWNPVTEIARCNFPANSGKSINFVSALWMSGYDAGGQLHIAAQTYRQDGNDYWPGPLDNNDTLTYATSHDWAFIWKVNRSDIQYFQSLASPDLTNTPPAILTWPGAGNTRAKGNGGAPLTFIPGRSYAPFIDLNHNGVYEPLLGDYPDIKGDQALWWVFSDNGPQHNQSNGRPLGVEIHAMAYAYGRGTLIDNVIYYDYKITNYSANTYNNFRVGLFDNIDLGFWQDDYIGFDSTHRMGIGYNANNDDGLAGGHPVNSYGTNIPMAGVTLIKIPVDVSGPISAGSFTYYNNDFSIIGNPTTAIEYDNYLRSKLRNGQPFTNDFMGHGIPTKAYGSGPNTNYVYYGDPSNPMEWSECNGNNTPGDRRFIITTNDFTLASGATENVVMALVTTNPDTMNGCPNHGFGGIKTVADTAWKIYYNPLPEKPAAVTNISTISSINIYPNPAHDKLFIENTGSNTNEETISIYNTIGKKIDVNIHKNGQTSELDISKLPAGLYTIRYKNNTIQQTNKFIKQ